MTTTIISNTPPFGALTNHMIADIFEINEAMQRLQAAVANAASGYDGTPGTEYEGNGTTFGVFPSNTPGAKGADYAYAINTLTAAWTAFWTSASGAIESLDNGVMT